MNTVLTDTLPSAITNVEYSTDEGTTWSIWNGSYSAGTLANGAVQTVLVRGVVSALTTGTIANTAVVSSDTPDPNPENNTSTALIPVGASADLSVKKTAFPTPVLAGEVLAYTIIVSNAGPNAAQNVKIYDSIPAAILSPEFAVQGETEFSPWASPYTIGVLEAGESFKLTIRGMVNPSAPPETITNFTEVRSTTPDPNPDNNTDTAQTPLILSADVAVFKSADNTPAIPGEAFYYTLTVLNAGPSDAQDVRLIDAVPSYLQNPEFSADGGITFLPWASPYLLGTLLAGERRTIQLRGTLSASTLGEIVNTAVVQSVTPDPQPRQQYLHRFDAGPAFR